jgi:hypothetical protein
VANAAKKGNVLEKLAQLVMVGAAQPLVSLCGAGGMICVWANHVISLLTNRKFFRFLAQ